MRHSSHAKTWGRCIDAYTESASVQLVRKSTAIHGQPRCEAQRSLNHPIVLFSFIALCPVALDGRSPMLQKDFLWAVSGLTRAEQIEEIQRSTNLIYRGLDRTLCFLFVRCGLGCLGGFRGCGKGGGWLAPCGRGRGRGRTAHRVG